MRKSPPLFVTMALLAIPSTTHAGNTKGKVVLDLELGVGGGRELVIREPEMCAGEASAKIKWNKNADKVSVKLKLEGVPHEPSYCYDIDPSNQYNQYPCVSRTGNGRHGSSTASSPAPAPGTTTRSRATSLPMSSTYRPGHPRAPSPCCFRRPR